MRVTNIERVTTIDQDVSLPLVKKLHKRANAHSIKYNVKFIGKSRFTTIRVIIGINICIASLVVFIIYFLMVFDSIR